MTAIRSVHASEGKFVQISNDLIRNEELSVLARFIVCYVLSLPPDHHFTAEWLETKLPGYGTRSIRAALGELKACGHMKVTRKSLGRGRWEWDQVISDGPIDGVTSERSSTHDTTCGNASSQVSSSERLTSDDGSSDDGRSDKRSNTEQAKDEDQKKAPRRAAHSVLGGETDTRSLVGDVRRAAVRIHGGGAQDLTDEQCMHIYRRFCCAKTGRPYKFTADVYAYLVGGPLKDVPTLEQALQPSAKRRIPMADLRRFNDSSADDDERMEIVESLTGTFSPGEIPAVESMLMEGRPLEYIVNVVSTGQLNVAA
jgi:hypothetical protein